MTRILAFIISLLFSVSAWANGSCQPAWTEVFAGLPKNCTGANATICDRKLKQLSVLLSKPQQCTNQPAMLKRVSSDQLCRLAQRWLRQEATNLKPVLLNILRRQSEWPSSMRTVLVKAGRASVRGGKILKRLNSIPVPVAMEHLNSQTRRMGPNSLKCEWLARRLLGLFKATVRRDASIAIVGGISLLKAPAEKLIVLRALRTAWQTK